MTVEGLDEAHAAAVVLAVDTGAWQFRHAGCKSFALRAGVGTRCRHCGHYTFVCPHCGHVGHACELDPVVS